MKDQNDEAFKNSKNKEGKKKQQLKSVAAKRFTPKNGKNANSHYHKATSPIRIHEAKHYIPDQNGVVRHYSFFDFMIWPKERLATEIQKKPCELSVVYLDTYASVNGKHTPNDMPLSGVNPQGGLTHTAMYAYNNTKSVRF